MLSDHIRHLISGQALLQRLVEPAAELLQRVKDDPAAAMKMNDPFPEATAKAKDFGLTVCGAS